jgi:selenide,water dikinase
MSSFDVHSCTDVTGFGFLGHACEMVEGTDVGMVIYSSSVPFFEEIQELVEMGMVPGGLHRNREFRMHMVEVSPDCPEWMVDILFDPQTSGGLLFSLPSHQAGELLKNLHEEDIRDAAIVGEVVDEPKERIVVTQND